MEYAEDFVIVDGADVVFNVTTTFAKDTKSTEIEKFSDRVFIENTPLLRADSVLKPKILIKIEDKDAKKTSSVIVQTTSQAPTTCIAHTVINIFGARVPVLSVPLPNISQGQGLTAQTAQSVNNTSEISPSTSSNNKGKRKATPVKNTSSKPNALSTAGTYLHT